METNQELEAELELSLLQIHQLQEELEYYYIEYSKLKQSTSKVETPYPLLRQARLNDQAYQGSPYKNQVAKLISENQDLKQALEQESGKLKVESEKLKAERDEAKAQAANKTKELESENELMLLQIHQLQEELESQINLTTENTEPAEMKEALELESGKLKAENGKLKVERDEAKSQLSNLTTENTELAKVKQALELESETLKAENEKLKVEINEVKSQVANKTKQLDELTKATEAKESELASRLSHLESENQELTRSARLNQKMLAKSQIDLDHLREKYAEKTKSETELVELITELREKLTVASQYYYQLQQEHPELLNHANTEHE